MSLTSLNLYCKGKNKETSKYIKSGVMQKNEDERGNSKS